MEDGFILYHAQTDRVHFLNATAVFVLEYCNGKYSPEEIADIMKDAWGLDGAPLSQVREIIERLLEEELVRSE